MKISKMVGQRLRENPQDITIKSHALMVRGGFIKQVANGIYSLLPPAKRATKKIENIIREEMDKIDGQEVLFPVVMPRELWEESGRYNSIAGELCRFKDRQGKDMLLGMTHEEAAVHMARNTLTSHNQLPAMIYQIQTKFRDELRARGGLIRVREFTMKDAYSFHMSQKDLEVYYDKCLSAYNRIFKRMGMKKFVAVKSDSGMMGGSVAHEFMLLTDIGEDTIVICPKCGYLANMEVAVSTREAVDFGTDSPLEEVFTGDAKEIKEVCDLLKIQPFSTLKAVAYAIKGEKEKSLLVFLRGDLEVNEAKLKKILGCDIAPSDLSNSQLVAGNIGPCGLSIENTEILFDNSVENAYNLVCGANKADFHFQGLNIKRDLKVTKFYDIAKVASGDNCTCGEKLILQNGIEIGNIFQLGTKYTKSMGMTVLDENGKAVVPIMGCYGIGVGRALASIIEECGEDSKINFPMTIAPWQVFLANIKPNDEKVKEESEKLYETLKNANVEVLFDDRKQSPGVKFKDGELLGVPIRVVVSPRSLETNEVEVTHQGETTMVSLDETLEFVLSIITKELCSLNS